MREYFKNIKEVKYEGVKTKNLFSYRHYDADKIVLGKPMKEHLKFAMAWWHTFTFEGTDAFGDATAVREWNEVDPMQTARNRVDAAFEMMKKMGIGYFCFHDVDIAPQGKNLAEFFKNIDEITDLMKIKMEETGIKLLWNTVNLFSHPRYVHGAASSNEADVFAISATTVKKGLEICKKLNGQNYVFWGGREGYEWLPNTNLKLEQDNIARFLKMAVDYAHEIGLKAQMLIEPKPKEPSTHQYDYDAATTMAFLQKYDLDKCFKLNLEANHATLAGHTFDHELAVANCYGALGSIDANYGETILGWDTDEFPTSAYDNTLAMYQVLLGGGLGTGGINFDAKIRRTSFEVEDLILSHIAGMDSFARGLLGAEKLIKEKFLSDIVEERYKSYNSGIGKSILEGKEDFNSLAEYAMGIDEPKVKSNHVEIIKSILNDYIE